MSANFIQEYNDKFFHVNIGCSYKDSNVVIQYIHVNIGCPYNSNVVIQYIRKGK